jgi:myo-inositol catabolism protein IolH
VRVAFDPTPYHAAHGLLDFARVAGEAGYSWYQLTPHVEFLPFFRHPRADDDLVAAVKRASKDAGVGCRPCLR